MLKFRQVVLLAPVWSLVLAAIGLLGAVALPDPAGEPRSVRSGYGGTYDIHDMVAGTKQGIGLYSVCIPLLLLKNGNSKAK